MAENKMLCEEIEIAIYSDTELTDEQKNHIENCESCKALLSQISQMKNDLGEVSVPGIAEGQITKSVMESIKRQKLSISFPKFKITHHLGTAVAVAIILVAALIIKNPAEDDNSKLSTKDFDNAPADYSDLPDDTSFSPAYLVPSGDTKQNDGIIPLTEETENEDMISEYSDVLKTKSIPDAEIAGTNRAKETESTNEAPTKFTAARPKNSSAETQDTLLQDANTNYNDDTAYNSDSNQLTESGTEESNASAGGGGGGAGGGSSFAEPVVPAPGDAYTLSETANKEYIFEGIEFLSGEENFDYNISIANQRLNERFGPNYRLSKEKLQKIGFDNDRLIKLAPDITVDMFEIYKNFLDIFE